MSILTQILEQMYVEPELLEVLPDEQKEVLFRKMREEQVRRWAAREKEERSPPRKRTTRKISFLRGADGQPWVWVMGEHKNDLPYAELVHRREREEQERERLSELQDRKEAEELARQEARGILSLAQKFGGLHITTKRKVGVHSLEGIDGTRGGRQSPRGLEEIPEEGARSDASPLPPSRSYPRTESQENLLDSPTTSRQKKVERKEEEEEVRKRLVRKASVIGTSKEEKLKFEQERAEELYKNMRRAKMVAKKRAEEMSKSVEERWKKSEEKVRTFERTRRMSIQKAKEMAAKSPDIPERILEQIPSEKKAEIVRKLSIRSQRRPVRPAPPRPLVKRSSFVDPGTQPKTPAHVVRWFRDVEVPKGVGLEKDGSISIWFHGKLGRELASKLLEGKPIGSYLVRLTVKVWGYAVSVKTYTGSKHFLIDASSGMYHFVGPKQLNFHRLSDLLKFYRVNPITSEGQEVLLLPVGQEEDEGEVFQGLFQEDGEEREVSHL